MENSSIHDAELLSRFVSTQDEEAFRLIADRHTPMVYAACRRRLKDSHQAEDATQAVFLILARKAGTIRRGNSLNVWLYRTADCVATDMIREHVSRKRRERKVMTMKQVTHATALDRTQLDELSGCIDTAVKSLNEKLQKAIIGYFFQGKTQKELAQETGCSEDAFQKRVSRGLKKLRAKLGKNGIVIPGTALTAFLTAEGGQAAPAGLAEACHTGVMSSLKGQAAELGRINAIVEKSLFSLKMRTVYAFIRTFIAVLAVTGIAGVGIVTSMNTQSGPAGSGVYEIENTGGETEKKPGKYLPAFPGAEGFGAVSKGGRGGRVIKVTNLNPKGPGSLQAACEAQGPRIVVFDVSGVIHGHLRIRHGQITIAGQTAPGAGITVNGRALCHGPMKDVIVRFLRIRPNPPRGHSGGKDGVQFTKIEGLIFDHVSTSWGGDETLSATLCGPLTIQWCAVEESALVSEGGVSPHNFGTLVGYTDKPITVHHTLYANHSDRFPQITNGKGIIDIRNNVAYNCGGSCAGVNIIGCYLKAGPGGPHGRRSNIAPFVLAASSGVSTSVIGGTYKGYARGNFHDLNGGYAFGTSARARRRQADKPTPAAPVKTHSAERAYELVLTHAGCLPRDEVLKRTVEEVRTGTGSWGAVWPKDGLMAGLKAGKALADSDNDGMPDSWEKAHKLNAGDPSDANTIVPAGASKGDRHKGYTYIEFYINECADKLIAEAIAQARAEEKQPAPPAPMKFTPWSTAQPNSKTDTPEVEKLIKILSGPKIRGVKKWRAARKLCYHNRPTSAASCSAIAKLVKHEDLESRRCASWVIGCMEKPPTEAIAYLAETTVSDDGVKGGGCFQIWALARIGPKAAKLALPALQKVKDPWAHWPLGYAVCRMGPEANKQAMPFLEKLIGIRNHQVKYWAAKAFADIGKDAVSSLSTIIGSRRGRGKEYAALALAWMGHEAQGAVNDLVKALDDTDASVRRRAALALACISPETAGVMAGLNKALKDQSWYVRHQAAQALSIPGPKAGAAVPALRDALNDEEPNVRAAAAETLGWIGSRAKSATGALIQVLKNDKDFWPRVCAAGALGRIKGGSGTVNALAEALADPDEEVRAEAAWALAGFGPAAKGTEKDLKKALDDNNFNVQFAAERALEQIQK